MSVLVGKQAPDFTVSAVMPDNTINDKFNFKEYIKGKMAVLFFWPADFSFVCPTEVIAFNNKFKEFTDRGVVLVGGSVDSQYVHLTWKKTPIEKSGVGDIQFPIISDLGGIVSKAYDVLSASNLAYRATFVIDQNGVVVHQLVNNEALGRDISETIRILDALLFTQKYGEVCPANWKKGQEGVKENFQSVAEYLEKYGNNL